MFTVSIESRLLCRCRFCAQRRKVQMFARGQNVVPHQPVSGHNLVEPCKPALVRVTAVTVLVKDVENLGRRLHFGCCRFHRDAWPHQLQRNKEERRRNDQLAKCLHRFLCSAPVSDVDNRWRSRLHPRISRSPVRDPEIRDSTNYLCRKRDRCAEIRRGLDHVLKSRLHLRPTTGFEAAIGIDP